jgi:hypothetical protein
VKRSCEEFPRFYSGELHVRASTHFELDSWADLV